MIASTAPHIARVEIPAIYEKNRLIVIAHASDGTPLRIWVDSNGSGFIREATVKRLHLRTNGSNAFLPPLRESQIPAPTADGGALPILSEADSAGDKILESVDIQLGWTWLRDRVWTIDMRGGHFYLDTSHPPTPKSASVATLTFYDNGRYPQIDAVVDGTRYRAALDTAATTLSDGVPAATSFVSSRIIDEWHRIHPAWAYIPDVPGGFRQIRVPELRIGNGSFRNVAFTTRPNDDVFQDDPVDLKINPTAIGTCTTTLDYPSARVTIECSR